MELLLSSRCPEVQKVASSSLEIGSSSAIPVTSVLSHTATTSTVDSKSSSSDSAAFPAVSSSAHVDICVVGRHVAGQDFRRMSPSYYERVRAIFPFIEKYNNDLQICGAHRKQVAVGVASPASKRFKSVCEVSSEGASSVMSLPVKRTLDFSPHACLKRPQTHAGTHRIPRKDHTTIGIDARRQEYPRNGPRSGVPHHWHGNERKSEMDDVASFGDPSGRCRHKEAPRPRALDHGSVISRTGAGGTHGFH